MTTALSRLEGFRELFRHDFEEMLSVLRREKTPSRVHFMELFLDIPIDNYLAMLDEGRLYRP